MSKALKPWEQQGCETCRYEAVGATRPPLVKVAENDAEHARLWRCEKCRAFWVEEERYMCEIDEGEARTRFPNAFAG